MNAGPQTIEAAGRNLHAASSRNGIHEVALRPLALHKGINISFKQEFGRDPKFRRGIYKVAFGSLAHFLGAAEALKDTYDPVRAFVRKGTNRFEILLMGNGTAKSHFFSQPIWLPHCTHPVAELAIFGISFMVDFDPMSKGLNQVRAALTGQSVENWTMV